jgi:RNA polymerase sigma-70 factor (ECF subfamily)
VNHDARDLAAARTGDDGAFGRLFRRHAPLVLSMCRGGCANDADAEDAMQETFIRAHDRLDRVDDPTGFRAWLCAIARHVCSERRRSARRRLIHENGFRGMQRGRSVEPTTGVPDRVAHDEALEDLTVALRALDERERLALHLHYLDADPTESAQSLLGVSRSGYYKLLARARSNLATRIREMQHAPA